VTLNFDLETGAQCRTCVRNVTLVVEYPPANFGYSFPIYGLLGVEHVDWLSVGGAKCHHYWSISQLQTAAAYRVEIDK